MTTPKKAFAAAFAVSVALISIGAAPALAADMNGNGHGSMKDRGHGGVPVPMPAPYEEHYKYYMGAGLGWTFKSSGDTGLTVGGIPVGAAPSFGGYDDFRGPGVVSLFAGRYITPSIRAEFGLDLRGAQTRSKTQTYRAALDSQMDFGGPGAPDVRTVTNTYDVARTDEVRLRNNTAMVNFYYDMNRGGRFNPYVGAGIGLSQVQIKRASAEIASCAFGTDDPITPTGSPTPPCWAGGTPGLPNSAFGTGEASATGYSVAGSLMAGFTYTLSARTHLDVGYRLMYQGAKATVSTASLGPCVGSCGFSGTSTIDIGSRVDHEIRTGVRWDLW